MTAFPKGGLTLKNICKEKLLRGEKVVGTFFEMGGASAVECLGLAGLDFHTAITISTVCAWVVFLLFCAAAVAAVRKSAGKGRSGVV